MWILNDLESQFHAKTQKMSKEDIHDTLYDLSHCNHLFVKLEEGNEKKQPIVECVFCGLTNKFMDLENKQLKKGKRFTVSDGKIQILPKLINETLESQEFKRQFLNSSNFNYLNNEVLDTNHPGLLFRLVTKYLYNVDVYNLFPSDLKIIFDIMKELNNMETDFERDHLMYPMDCDDLLSRYRKSKGIKIIKK